MGWLKWILWIHIVKIGERSNEYRHASAYTIIFCCVQDGFGQNSQVASASRFCELGLARNQKFSVDQNLDSE